MDFIQCAGNETEEDRVDRIRNRALNKKITEEKPAFDHQVRMLLLGAGESGKSTIFKQMRLINLSDFNDNEREQFKDTIYLNVVTDIFNLVEGCEKLEIPISDSTNAEFAKSLFEIYRVCTSRPTETLTEEVGIKISKLWKDQGIQKAFSKRSEFQLNDTADYFLDKVLEISKSKYVPSTDDILRSRKRTTGCVETMFKADGHQFKLIDVGGQRMERKKWMKVLDNITCMLFITSLSEYDQVLFEDETQNRMTESLELFEEILSLPYFSKTTIMIFFNKEDLFKKKIKYSDPKICFGDYSGGLDEEKAKKFIVNKFLSKAKKKDQIVHHFTTATDTDIMKKIFGLVKAVILKNLLDEFKM